MLAKSTEQAVTIAGVLQSVTGCTKQICLGMLEMLSQSPEWRVKTILYQPMPDSSLVICEGGQVWCRDAAGYPTPSMT